jgi:FtsH-binding integral membrane protein
MEPAPAIESQKNNDQKEKIQPIPPNYPSLQEQDLNKEKSDDTIFSKSVKVNFDSPFEKPLDQNTKNFKDTEYRDNHIVVNVPTKDVQVSSSSDKNIDLAINISIRSKFMLKVFGILLFQFIITFGVILITQIQTVKTYLHHNMILCIVLLCVSIFIYLTAFIVFTCNPALTRKVPINYIILFLITISFTVILSFISSLYNFEYVLGAISFIIAICLSIFCIALFNKIDIKFLAMTIISLFFLALTYGLLALIMRSYYLVFLYCVLVAILYALFIVYDTILIRDHFDIDDYIFAALTLYFDIIRLFILILRILGSRKN